MSLLNDASLVFIPSGYKEDKVYSVIPSNGAGDLDFVRGCDATRINPQSLVENTPWNLLQYSEDFTNSYWYKSQTTITSNAIVAPNGTISADKLEATNTSSNYINEQTGFNLDCTRYVYAKAGNYSQITILWNNYNNGMFATFNLSAGTVTYGGSGITASIESVGNGWYKCITSGFTNYPFLITLNGVSNNAISVGSYVYIWGAQLNIVSTAKPYFPTTDRLNVPRLTYENGCPSLLLEKQSINISQFAEVGTGGFLAATVTNGTELLGLKTFKILTDNTAYGDSPYINTNTEYQANTAYTLSFYTDFSKSNGTTISASMLGFFPGVAYAGITINKSTKSITTFNVGGIWTINSYTANQISGEIYRIVVTCTPNATSAGGSRNYINADNTFYAEVCGVQVEASVYPTSYIYKPASTSVTRLADSCYKTGISSLIGQTEGTVFLDYIPKSDYSLAEQNLLTLYGSANADNFNIQFYITSGGPIRIVIIASGALQSNINTGISSLTSHKIAVSYKQNNIVVYIDGNEVGTDTSANIPQLNSIVLNNYATGNYMSNSSIKTVALWKRTLTSTELAQLTTL